MASWALQYHLIFSLGTRNIKKLSLEQLQSMPDPQIHAHSEFRNLINALFFQSIDNAMVNSHIDKCVWRSAVPFRDDSGICQSGCRGPLKSARDESLINAANG
jgi:hypothetical protein